MKKKLALILTAAMIAGTLTACGGAAETTAETETAAETTEATEDETVAAEETAEADTDAEEQTGELQVITVAATAVPHAEILEAAKPLLAEQGYDLQVTVFDDYVQPNNVVESGEIDANYFQIGRAHV